MANRMQLIGKKGVLDMYKSGGWDVLNTLKDTPDNRREVEYIIQKANNARDKLKVRSVEEAGFYSPALEATNKDKLGQKAGAFETSADWNKQKSEALRAITFLNDETSSVTGTRQHNKDTRQRVFRKGFRGQTASEESARWRVITDIRKKNPGLFAKAGDVGGWIDSDTILEWSREYNERAEDDPRGFAEYLRDKSRKDGICAYVPYRPRKTPRSTP